MKSKTQSKCTVPWVPDNKVICKTWLEMNASYWEHYNRITNQQVWNVEVKVYSLHKFQGDCPNPCNFLAVTAGGQNRETLADNKSQVRLKKL